MREAAIAWIVLWVLYDIGAAIEALQAMSVLHWRLDVPICDSDGRRGRIRSVLIVGVLSVDVYRWDESIYGIKMWTMRTFGILLDARFDRHEIQIRRRL